MLLKMQARPATHAAICRLNENRKTSETDPSGVPDKPEYTSSRPPSCPKSGTTPDSPSIPPNRRLQSTPPGVRIDSLRSSPNMREVPRC